MEMRPPLKVLLIEDALRDADLVVRELSRGYDVIHARVDSAQALQAALDAGQWDLVIADYTMPGFSGMAALQAVQQRGVDVPFIFVSGSIGEDTAVDAMRAGAHDYLMKGSLKRLIPAVARELREASVRRERHQAEATIQHMAYYDAVTDLPNRNTLYTRLLNAIRTSEGDGSLALLLMDLDRFKEINDTLGHQRGDVLLRDVGARVRAALQEPDLVARLGGDEFAVLLPARAPLSDIQAVARRVLEALERPFLIEGLPVAVEASMGIALYPEHGANPDSLLQRAEVAMYAAKKSGGYLIYDSSYDDHSPRRLALLGELRQALERHQLLLHYQPKIAFATRRLISVEALVRWQHPTHGLIPPDQFIAPAERTGLIKPLTLWVLNAALAQCAGWRRAGLSLPIAVNLSVRMLHDPKLPDQIADLLGAHAIAPSALNLEITESAIMADPGRAREILVRLRELGIWLSIDDFGTGYSSLGYLKNLPVSEIKIDKAFVTGLGTQDNAEAIVRSIIDLGHHLGLTVVAEGVENEAEWNRLSNMGCDAAQGYYLSRPMPAGALAGWVRESPFARGAGIPDTGMDSKAA